MPRTPRGAVAFVAFFSMATALVSWGLSLIFSGVLVREIVKNVRGIDYRAAGAAAYVGTGSVWALGLSSSAALVMATPSSIPAALLKISGVIPLSQTIYAWQSIATAGILMLACVLVAYLFAPAVSEKTAESFGITEGLEVQKKARGAPRSRRVARIRAPAFDFGRNPRPRLSGASPGGERPARRARPQHLQSPLSDVGTSAPLEARGRLSAR